MSILLQEIITIIIFVMTSDGNGQCYEFNKYPRSKGSIWSNNTDCLCECSDKIVCATKCDQKSKPLLLLTPSNETVFLSDIQCINPYKLVQLLEPEISTVDGIHFGYTCFEGLAICTVKGFLSISKQYTICVEKIILDIFPRELEVDGFLVCIVWVGDKSVLRGMSCFINDTWHTIRSLVLKTARVDAYYLYAFQLIKVENENMVLLLQVQDREIKCRCEGFLPISYPVVPTVAFYMPKTASPTLDLSTNNISIPMQLGCITNFLAFFTIHWICFYENYTIQLGDDNASKILTGNALYIYNTLTVNRDNLIIQYLILNTTLGCQCKGITNSNFNLFPHMYQNFTIPILEPPLILVTLNCSNLCQYNIFSPPTLYFNVTSIRKNSFTNAYVSINISMYSYILSIYKPGIYAADFMKHYSITKPLECQDIIIENRWIGYISFKSWTVGIMFYNKTAPKSVNSLLLYQNYYFKKDLNVTCYLVDSQGGNSLINTSFYIIPFKARPYLKQTDDYLHLAYTNTTFNYEVTITCNKNIQSLTSRSWCKLFYMGGIKKYFSMKSFRNMHLIPKNYEIILFTDGFKIHVEMYYPILVYVDINAINPTHYFTTSYQHLKYIPKYIKTWKFHKNQADGFLQFFYTTKSSDRKINVVKMLTMGIIGNTVRIYIDPGIVKMGYEITCVSSSADAMFIFEWWCKFRKKFYRITFPTYNISNDDDIEKKRFFENLFLTEVQTMRFEYFLPENIYICNCTLITYGLGRKKITISQTFELDLQRLDYATIFSVFGGVIYTYQVLVILLWAVILSSPMCVHHYLLLYFKHKRMIKEYVISILQSRNRVHFWIDPYENYNLKVNVSEFVKFLEMFRITIKRQKRLTCLIERKKNVIEKYKMSSIYSTKKALSEGELSNESIISSIKQPTTIHKRLRKELRKPAMHWRPAIDKIYDLSSLRRYVDDRDNKSAHSSNKSFTRKKTYDESQSPMSSNVSAKRTPILPRPMSVPHLSNKKFSVEHSSILPRQTMRLEPRETFRNPTSFSSRKHKLKERMFHDSTIQDQG